MGRLLVGMAAALAVAAAPSAAAVAAGPTGATATRNVSITRSGFVPATVSIQVGDRVVWRNADSTRHQVVADNGTFASPILAPRQSFGFTFRASGTYRYRDTFNTKLRGTVRVSGPPPSISIATSAPILYYGSTATLSGVVSNHRAGENVTVLGKPYPQTSFAVLATVVTGTGGAWSYVTKPTILTDYQATWNRASSVVVRTEIKPRIEIWYSRRTRVFWTAVAPAASQAGHTLYFQRLSSFGQWVTRKRVPLSGLAAAKFRASLPRGRSRVRLYMTVNQAGPGFLSSESGVWTLVRR
jgi:plastocyanin